MSFICPNCKEAISKKVLVRPYIACHSCGKNIKSSPGVAISAGFIGGIIISRGFTSNSIGTIAVGALIFSTGIALTILYPKIKLAQ
jgi:hypothetical protein